MTAETTSRAYAGKSLDERREARRLTLLETGLDVLHREGLTGISVRLVCAQAKLTPRYFYENFANLDALLVGLVDYVGDVVKAEATKTLLASTGTMEERGQAVATAVYDVIDRDERKGAVMLASAAHEHMYRRQQRRFLDYAELLWDFLYSQDPSLDPRLDRSRLRPISLFLVGGVVELISAKITGLIEISAEQLIETCGVMVGSATITAGITLPEENL